jgi:IS605 OrfB family transposase
LWSHQLEFVISEYLHLRRAAEIARAGGDIEKATKSLGIEGKAAVKHKFMQFVQRFQDRYGFAFDEAKTIALRMGEMSDWFLVAPEGSDIRVPQNMHGFFQRLTKITKTGFSNVHPKEKPEYMTDWLLDFQKRGIVQFDRDEMLGIGWSEKLYNTAAHHIRSQGELRKQREKDRADWRAARDEFEKKHERFFAERYGFFREYEEQRTKQSAQLLAQSQPGRKMRDDVRIRGRMVKGINRVMAAWADEGLWKPKKPVEHAYLESRIERRKAIFHNLREADGEAFGDHLFFGWLAEHADDWPGFPDDLKVLLDYNSRFLDDRMPKPIGFSRPSFDKHPIWYELEECFDPWPDLKYYKADFAAKTLFMRVVMPKADTRKEKGQDRWNPDASGLPPLSDSEIEDIIKNPSLATVLPVSIPFKPDSRLCKNVSVDESADRQREFPYLIRDEITKERYPFRLGGIKLVFRPRPVDRKNSDPYAYFSAQVQMPFDRPRRAKAESRKLEPGTRVLSVDLGCRHRAFGAVREYDGIGGSIPVWSGPIKPPGGRHLAHVDAHEEAHRKKRSASQKSKTGKMKFLKRGQVFDVDFREHIVNLKDDIAKQTAHAIVETAVKHKASVIVMELLEGYKPQTDRTRRENRRLRTASFRALYHELTSEKGKGKNRQGVDRAGAYGIPVYSFAAAYSSRVCHKCGWPGNRWSEIPESLFRNKTGKDGLPLTHRKIAGKEIVQSDIGKVLVQPGGKLFCCSNPECGVVKINADYNAAQNLQRQFCAEKLIESRADGEQQKLKHPAEGWMPRKEFWKQVESGVVSKLASRGFQIAGLTKRDVV